MVTNWGGAVGDSEGGKVRPAVTLGCKHPGISPLTARLREIIRAGRGARIGESAVVSTRIHLVSTGRPEEVQVMTDADAGRVFYGRRHEGEVLHLDVFHQCGALPHRGAAGAVMVAVDAFLQDFSETVEGDAGFWRQRLGDYIDLQTATGGGRVTGSLTYGIKASLRRAHLTHVHLALMVPEPMWGVVFYLVDHVESLALAVDLEIRKVERILNLRGGRGGADLSPYASHTDSLLKGDGRDYGEPQNQEGLLQRAVRLADRFESLAEVAELLEGLESWKRLREMSLKGRTLSELAESIDRITREGLAARLGEGFYLTAQGRQMRDYLRSHGREVEMVLKKNMRRLSTSVRDRLDRFSHTFPLAEGRPGTRKTAARLQKGQWLTDIAVPETVVAAMASSVGEGGSGPIRWRVDRENIHVYHRDRYQRVDVCLLIDASASMAGERIRAAKFLAQHLLLSTRDKVAVLIFQERRVELAVPFTRNYREVEQGLKGIRPFGLTPMAEGLVRGLNYIKSSAVKNPLLLMITDGIPTVPRGSINPLDDALEAARAVGRDRVRFACIGLEPNFDYLNQLVQNGAGSLYVVDELEKETLVAIAHQERARQRQHL